MPEGGDIADHQLSRGQIEQLMSAGVILEARRETVVAASRAEVSWKPWILFWTSVIGAAFLLSGVIFFFAWNWRELSPLTRFGVLEGGVVLATIAALLTGIGSTGGRFLLLTSSVLTGVLVAVYGQVYQTGADAFEVFALWAVLIIGWVLVSRFAGLWLVWLAVVQTAIATWFGQVPVAAGEASWSAMFLTLGGFCLAVVALREWLCGQDRFAWLRGEWLRLLLWLVCLVWLSLVAWDAILDFDWRDRDAPTSRPWGLLLWTATVVGGAWFFTRIRPSHTALGFSVLSAAIIVVVWIGKEIIGHHDDGPGGFLLASLVALGVFAGAATLIAKASRWMPGDGEAEHSGEEETP